MSCPTTSKQSPSLCCDIDCCSNRGPRWTASRPTMSSTKSWPGRRSRDDPAAFPSKKGTFFFFAGPRQNVCDHHKAKKMNVPFLLPSRRLVYWGAAATAASLGVLVFPAATLLLLTVDLVLVAAALLDWLITPGAEALEA